jgi:hypothetical protein
MARKPMVNMIFSAAYHVGSLERVGYGWLEYLDMKAASSNRGSIKLSFLK